MFLLPLSVSAAAAGAQSAAAPSASAGTTSAAQLQSATIGRAPMNSVMREAQGGGATQMSGTTMPVQSTPTNAMTLTLRSSNGTQGPLGSSAQDAGNRSTNGASYDAYGLRNNGGANGQGTGGQGTTSQSSTPSQGQPH